MPASVADFTSECTVAFAGTRNKFFSVERTAMSTTPQFGILTDMRKMTEQNGQGEPQLTVTSSSFSTPSQAMSWAGRN